MLCSNVLFADNLLIKVGDTGVYSDKDVVCAMTTQRINLAKIQSLTNVRNATVNSDGLREPGSLLDICLQNISKYKFERISEGSVRRTNLDTLKADTITDKANAQGEYMDVPLYIKRRLEFDKHKIFGSVGSEYWYGGRSVTDAKIDIVWTAIEAQTSERKADNQEWGFSDKEKKRFLVLTVDPITEEEAEEYVISEFDTKGNMTKKRKYQVDYEKDLSLSQGEIDDIKDKEKDSKKNTTYDHITLVKEKL